MQVINNRYKVIKRISKHSYYSFFEVVDMLKDNYKLRLVLINPGFFTKEMRNHLKREFINLTNLKQINIREVYNFDVVSFIDNKHIDGIEWYYTCELDINEKKLSDVIHTLSEKETIELFLQICRAVQYTHRNGYTYDSIKINNIYVVDENGKLSIKINDLVSSFIQNNDDDLMEESEGADRGLFSNNFNSMVKSNIHDLGNILFQMCSKKLSYELNVEHEIEKFKKNLDGGYYSKSTDLILMRVISIFRRMLLENGYMSVNDVVKDINRLLNMNYRAFDINSLSKLNYYTKLAGRNEEVGKVMSIYNDIKEGNKKSNVVVVHGVNGIGKTRFINEIDHLIKFKDNNVFSSYSKGSVDNKKRNVFFDIFRSIVVMSEMDISKRHGNDVINILHKFMEDNKISSEMESYEERFKLLNKCNKFINEAAKDKPIVLIIDDVNEIEELDIEFIKYLYGRMENSKNILLIISYSDEEVYRNNKFKSFTELFKKNTTEILLKELNKEETSEYIQYIMGVSYKLNDFSNKVFNKTNGNPTFIIEVIKSLFNQKCIYVDVNEGKWFMAYKEINELPIHTSVFQVIENKIKSITDYELKLINAVAIFNMPVEFKILSIFLQEYEESSVKNIVYKFLNEGILESVEYKGAIGYIIPNKMFKSILIERMEQSYKVEFHEKAANILEEIDKIKYSDEILFHFENSLNTKKVIDYYLRKYRRPLSVDDRDKAINNIKRLVNRMENDIDNPKEIKLIIILGELLIFDGKSEEAKFYFMMAEKWADRIKDYDIKFNAISRIVELLQDNYEIEKANEYIEKQEEILKLKPDLRQELHLMLEKAINFYNTQEYEKAFEICNDVLSKCEEDFDSERCICYYVLSNIFIDKEQINLALSYVEKCIRSKGFTSNIKYILDSMNTMSYIYGTCLQNIKGAKKCLKDMLEISNKFKYFHFKLLAESQIAALEMEEMNYSEAEIRFDNVVKLSRKINDKLIELYCYCKLCQMHLRTYRYSEASKYFAKVAVESDDFKNNTGFMTVYYELQMEINIRFGAVEEAYSFRNKFKDIYSSFYITDKVRFMEKFCDFIVLKDDTSRNSLKENIKHLEALPNNINELINAAMFLYVNDYMDIFDTIYDKVASMNLKNSYFDNKILILKALKLGGKEALSFCIKALISCRDVSNNLITSAAYCVIGRYHYKTKNYLKAINYLFENVDRLWRCLSQIPQKFRRNFFLRYKIGEYISELTKIINEYCETELIKPINSCEDFSDEAIEKYAENFNLKKLFYYEKYKKDIKECYLSYIPRCINSTMDIIKNLSSFPVENINNILRYLKYITFSNSVYLAIKQEDDNIVFDGYRPYINNDILKNNLIIKRVIARKNLIFIKRVGLKREASFKENEKAVICIPIYNVKTNKKENLKNSSKEVSGILYLETDKMLNNFNIESVNKCIEFNGILNLSIEGYKVNRSSSIDKLTGTLVRRQLETILDNTIKNSRDENKGFSILMYDLDNFKGINDKFGHRTGDEVLKRVSSIVLNTIDEKSSCIRYGGEEFIVVLPGFNKEEAFKFANQIRSKVAKEKILKGKRSVTISVGVASYPDIAIAKEELIEKADKALYMAKNNGKNQCIVWNEDFGYKAKVTNKITGIISGNPVQDSRNVLVLVELIEMLKDQEEIESKIFKLLGRLTEFFEASYCSILLLNGEEVVKTYTRKIFETKLVKERNINRRLIDEVCEKKIGVYLIDWDTISGFDGTTGLPDWDSVMVIPLINKGITKGVLYFNVPTKKKEFNFEEFNFASSIANIIAAFL